MGQKCVFLKMILDHLGCSRVTKCLEKGLFWTKEKLDQKCVFPKILLNYLGCTNKWNEPILGPYWAILAPLKAQKGLENGPNGDDKWLKDRSKPRFSKHDPGSLVVPKRMNIAHFEPHLGRSRPLS